MDVKLRGSRGKEKQTSVTWGPVPVLAYQAPQPLEGWVH